jgi:hypothetical protein
MGQVALVQVGAQGCAVPGDGDGFGRERITDEVADGEMHVERQDCTNEGEAAGHHGLEAMLVVKVNQGAEAFSGALGLAVGGAGFGQGAAAWPVFEDGRS